MEKILALHKLGSADSSKGKFNSEYSNEKAIRKLVEDAWRQATPDDVGPGRWKNGRAVIAAQVLGLTDGVPQPYIIGTSGLRPSAPSIPTNTYVVIIDSNNNVVTCYPINPTDKINPRDE
jgi:hypothetical protein